MVKAAYARSAVYYQAPILGFEPCTVREEHLNASRSGFSWISNRGRNNGRRARQVRQRLFQGHHQQVTSARACHAGCRPQFLKRPLLHSLFEVLFRRARSPYTRQDKLELQHSCEKHF